MANVPFSSDEDFNELRDKDRTVELLGYVHEVQGAQEVGKTTKYKLLKFSLSNGGLKKIQCLIWGDGLINQYQSELTTNKILHIDGAHCKACQLSYRMESDNYVPFELIIQKSTIINFLGVFEQHAVVPPAKPKDVNFLNINETGRVVSIDGYIKTKFVVTPSRFENASYGCGSITDGEYKITVHIINYTPLTMEKGVAVNVVGEVNTNRNEPLTITCKDITEITLRTGIDPLPPLDVLRGGRTPKRKLPTP